MRAGALTLRFTVVLCTFTCKVAYEGSSFCAYTDYALSMDLSQITPAVVPELTKVELKELGVRMNRLGDQKRLRAACNPPATG